MRIRWLLLIALFFIPLRAQAQGVRVGDNPQVTSSPVSGGQLFAVANANISFCSHPANAVPCTNKVTTYTDITLTTSCPTSTQVVLAGTNACVANTDGLGNWGVNVPLGVYDYTIQLPGGGSIGPYTVTQSGASVLLSTNNTWTGSNNFLAGLFINSLPGVSVSGTPVAGDCASWLSPSILQDSGGTCGGGGGGGSFGTLSTGTNTQAAMTVGTGASLLTSGSGTIAATSAPFAGVSGGTNAQALVVGTGGTLNPTGSGVINANRINATTIPVNSAADQALLTSASAVGLWSSIPICLDAAGQHLNYNTATHAFSCGTSGGTAGSAAFNTITSGTNASAAMVVGTGSSLAVSGSGTIAATSAPFAGVLSGTNTGSNMVLGTGSSLTVSGSGTNNATAINSTTVPVNSAADQVINTTASATGQWTSLPGCLDAGGNHLNYNTSTHLFSCGTSGGTAGSAAFNTITSGTNSSAAMLVGTGSSLGFSGTGTITASAMLFSGLTTATNTAATMTIGTGAVMTTSGTGTINANIITGTTVPASSAADQFLGTTASGVGQWALMPNCLDVSGQHINYNVSIHAFACGTTSSGGGGGGSGTVVASPQYQLAAFPTSGSVATVQGSGIFTDSTFNNLYISGTTCISGPSPWADITCPPYYARPVQINTTATGSGTSITVGVSTFKNNDYITIAGVGNAPTITNPTALTVTPMVSAGFSAQDTPSTPGLSGASAYQYTIFPIDILGGANAPVTPVSITTGNATIGSFPSFAISTESLFNNTLTLVTTSATGLPLNAQIHVTGTSNNHYFGGWYPISSISGSTITVNNVSQYCNPACTGTGGQLVAFVGNVLKWVAAAPTASLNSTWEYGICAKRPTDSALHLIAVTYPQSLSNPANANIVQIYNDYGPNFNTPVPWYLSDANCTAGSAQAELYTGQVTAGGGTTTLTVTPTIPIAPTGQAARYDAAPAIQAAINAAGVDGTAYIPPNGGVYFPLNSFLNVPAKHAVSQQGSILANATIYASTVGWYGLNSSVGGGQFDQSLGPIIQCTASPCFYTGAAQQGNTQVTNVTFNADHNTVIAMLDSSWGQKWLGDTFHFVGGTSDYSGNCVLIRPQGAEYSFRDMECLAGPGQFAGDGSWAPGFYEDGLCGGTSVCPNTGSVGTTYLNNITITDRGFLNEANDGSGISVKVDVGYAQGNLTPAFSTQNTNGNINSTFTIDHWTPDTSAQAVFANICGIGCASQFNGAAAVSPKMDHIGPMSQDNGTIPWQITGGGNARMLVDLAVFAQGGQEQGIPNTATLSRGLYFSEYRNYLYGGVLTNDPNLGVSDFQPNVPTPEVSLEQGTFLNNEVSAILTSNQTRTAPNASGVECLTGLVDCSYTLDTGAANAYATSVPVITALVDGMKFRIKAAHANTTTSTLVVNAFTSHNIQKFQSGSLVNLSANDIGANCNIEVTWDSADSVYQLTAPCNGGSGGGSGTVNNSAVANTAAYYAGIGTAVSPLAVGALEQYAEGIDSGSANVYVITTTPNISGPLVDGVGFFFHPLNGNTGNSTVAFDGISTVPLQKLNGSPLLAGDILAGGTYDVKYNSTLSAWIVLNPSSFSSVISIAQGGTGQSTANSAFNALAPATSNCGLIIANGVNSYGNLGCGSNGQTLQVTGGALTFASPSTLSGTASANQVATYSGASTLAGSANFTFSAGSGLSLQQGANNTTMLYGSRFTDVSPTGFFAQFQNAAKTTNVYSIDASGNVVAGGSITSGTSLAVHMVQIPEGTVTGCASGFDTLSADATSHTLQACNNNGAFATVVLAGADINASGQVTTTHLTGMSTGAIPKVSATGGLVTSFLSDNATNGIATEDVDFVGNAHTNECTNDVSTGTTNNLLMKFTSTGCIKATTSDTAIPVFIVARGGGTSGAAQYVAGGIKPCTMDATQASNARGFYVIASTGTGADCHPQSAAPAVGTYVVGQVFDNSTASGSAANVDTTSRGFYVAAAAGTGTVTSIATTAPLGGGTITTTGTLTCATCVTSSSPGAGIAHFAGATQAVTSSAVVAADLGSHSVTSAALSNQYSTWTCETGIGDGLNAIPAGTYLQYFCVNKTGVTVTLGGLLCFTDNAGSSTMNAANNAATGLLTGAVTCNSTKTGGGAAGTQSATTTLASNDAINFTFVADGTSKQATFTVTGTY